MLKRKTPMKRSAFKSAAPAPAPAKSRPEALRVPARTAARAAIRRVTAPTAAVPKQPREKNPHLLAMAKGRSCLMRWRPGCRGDEGSTTVQAHDNRLTANKGKGYKAHDWRSLRACDPCHAEYDQGKATTREEKDAAFDAGYARQLADWRDTATNPLARPKDREAAAWALRRYELHKLKGTLDV